MILTDLYEDMAFKVLQCTDFSSLPVNYDCNINYFSSVHINIRSIRKYWNQFRILVNSVSILFAAYIPTEINISAEATNLFCLPGYSNFFNARPSGRGGGIAVYVSEDWIATSLNFPFPQSESLLLRPNNHHYSILLWAFYRPSNHVSRFLSELSGAISELGSREQ